MSLKDQIKQANRMRITPYQVEDFKNDNWDGIIYLRELSAADKDQWEIDNYNIVKKSEKEPEGFKNSMSKFLLRVICDENGSLVYNHRNKEDLEEVSSLPSSIIKEIWNKAREVNGYTDKKINEELEKKITD